MTRAQTAIHGSERPNAQDIAEATRLFEQTYADSWWLNDPHYRENGIRQLAVAAMHSRVNAEHRARFSRKGLAA